MRWGGSPSWRAKSGGLSQYFEPFSGTYALWTFLEPYASLNWTFFWTLCTFEPFSELYIHIHRFKPFPESFRTSKLFEPYALFETFSESYDPLNLSTFWTFEPSSEPFAPLNLWIFWNFEFFESLNFWAFELFTSLNFVNFWTFWTFSAVHKES